MLSLHFVDAQNVFVFFLLILVAETYSIELVEKTVSNNNIIDKHNVKKKYIFHYTVTTEQKINTNRTEKKKHTLNLIRISAHI